MKYQVGDEIIVLLSNEEGRVVEIMNDKMVMIEVRGVKFPAYMDQIDFPYFHRFTKHKIVPEKKAPKVFIDQVPAENTKPTKMAVDEGVWLVLVPKFALDDFNDEIVELFKIFLVNKTGKKYQFVYKQLYSGNADFELNNEINPFHDFYIHDIPFANLNDSPSFNCEFTLVPAEKGKEPHFETQLKLKPKQVFQKVEEMKDKNQPTLSYQLFEKYPDKAYDDNKPDTFSLAALASKGYKVYDASKIKQHLEQPRTLIDLHIEKLTHSWQHLSNVEILGIQLNEFNKWLELAIVHHLPQFTVIHGVGKGKLKEEIHQILKRRKEVKSFVNQYHDRFGYGATEIYFN
ncbi:MAG: Smr/MutS family protein [Chitinophagaceae bacterium]